VFVDYYKVFFRFDCGLFLIGGNLRSVLLWGEGERRQIGKKSLIFFERGIRSIGVESLRYRLGVGHVGFRLGRKPIRTIQGRQGGCCGVW